MPITWCAGTLGSKVNGAAKAGRPVRMPKRKCPFGDTAPLQLKTHVGFKETATEADMREVYGTAELILCDFTRLHPFFVFCPCTDRTRLLLFQGANPALQCNGHTRNGHSQVLHNGHHVSQNGTHFVHRLHVSGDGSMDTTGKQVTKKPVDPVRTCACCRKTFEVTLTCVSCSRSVCGGCLPQCCVCRERFCQFCTVLK